MLTLKATLAASAAAVAVATTKQKAKQQRANRVVVAVGDVAAIAVGRRGNSQLKTENRSLCLRASGGKCCTGCHGLRKISLSVAATHNSLSCSGVCNNLFLCPSSTGGPPPVM